MLGEVLDLVLPQACAGCGRGSVALCGVCGPLLVSEPGRVWPRPVPGDLPPVWAVAGYGGPVRAVIAAHKERGRIALAEPLGLALARALVPALAAVGEAGGGAGAEVLVVPVPSARRNTRGRGHDPTRRMVAVAVRELRRRGFAVNAAAVLRQRRRVADQAGLTRPERAVNLSGALAARRGVRLAGRAVVVADDVVTSGATLAEAARALRAAGAGSVAAGAVAATSWNRREGDFLRRDTPGR